jgi:hypothetical protein
VARPGQWDETLTLLREEILSIVKEQLRRVADAGLLREDIDIPTAGPACSAPCSSWPSTGRPSAPSAPGTKSSARSCIWPGGWPGDGNRGFMK